MSSPTPCSPPEGQPGRREARREERRDHILEVAGKSFMENGYAGTTMSAIASTLGGSKGTLWSYFPSKDVLFDAFLDRATQQFRAELQLKLREADTLERALGRLGEILIAKLTSPDTIALLRLVIGEAGRFPEVGRIYYERGPQPMLELVSGLLQHAMDRGLLRRDDPRHAAQYLVALYSAAFNLTLQIGVRNWPTAAEIRTEAHNAVTLFLRAYAPAEQPD